MPPKRATRAAAPLTLDDIEQRDAIPSMKNQVLFQESLNEIKEVDVMGLSKDDLFAWFLFLQHTTQNMYHKYTVSKKELTSTQEELKKMKSLNESLKESTKQQSCLQEIQKFEKHTLQTVITASNMRTILLDIGFPSREVSRNLVSALCCFSLYSIGSHPTNLLFSL
jgi:hypothetical protein